MAQKSDQILNTHAKALIKQLPDHIGEVVEQLVEQYRLPMWQFVDGILLDAYYSGRLSAFQLDPAWKDGFRGEGYVCKHCGQEFVARRIGQVFCTQICATAFENKGQKNVADVNTNDTLPVESESNSDGDTPPQTADEGGVVPLFDAGDADAEDEIGFKI